MVEDVLALVELDELPAPGAAAVAQRSQGGEGGARARGGVHVRRARTGDELRVEVAAEPQHAGEPVELRAEARVTGPVPGEACGRHAHDDELGMLRL